MFPLLSIVIALSLGLSYRGIVRGHESPDLTLAVMLVVAYTGLAFLLTIRAVRQTLRASEPGPEIMLRTGFSLRLGALVTYGILVYTARWPTVVDRLGIGGWVLVDELLVLLPYFVLLVVSFLATWQGESRLELHEFTRGAYLKFQLQQYILPIVPVLCVLVLPDLADIGSRRGIRWVAELQIRFQSYPFVQWLGVIALLFLLYCLIPFFLRLLWGLRPLPSGPLRSRLMEFADRERFRARDILMWPTGGNVMNAAVIGIAAPVRYVLITDALLDSLDEDEVEAVFAHEVGHAKHNHFLLFLLFNVGYVMLATLLGRFLDNSGLLAVPQSTFATVAYYVVLVVGGFLAWFGILFGFLSRRFEQQADVYGAESLDRVRGNGDGPAEEHPFVRALERLSQQMGDIREVKGWRHFSLADRISFLTGFVTDPEVRSRYRRRMRALFFFFFGLLGAIGLTAAATVPSQLREGRDAADHLRARWLVQQGRTEEAIWDTLERAARVTGRDQFPILPSLVRGHPASATEALMIFETPGLPPHVRVHNTAYLAGMLVQRGQVSGARGLITEEMRRSGELSFLLLHLARLLRHEGRTKGARLAFAAALERMPTGARYGLAESTRKRVVQLLEEGP